MYVREVPIQLCMGVLVCVYTLFKQVQLKSLSCENRRKKYSLFDTTKNCGKKTHTTFYPFLFSSKLRRQCRKINRKGVFFLMGARGSIYYIQHEQQSCYTPNTHIQMRGRSRCQFALRVMLAYVHDGNGQHRRRRRHVRWLWACG